MMLQLLWTNTTTLSSHREANLLLEDARVTTITVSSQREATCVWKIPQSLWTNATTLSSHREATYCRMMLQLLWTNTTTYQVTERLPVWCRIRVYAWWGCVGSVATNGHYTPLQHMKSSRRDRHSHVRYGYWVSPLIGLWSNQWQTLNFNSTWGLDSYRMCASLINYDQSR